MLVDYQGGSYGERALADVALDREDFDRLRVMLEHGGGAALVSVTEEAVIVVRVAND